MNVFSDLLLTMYNLCLATNTKHQIDTLLDAKVVLDHYLETKNWPDFWVYYRANGTDLFINDENFLNSSKFYYARNVYPKGILVKYSVLDGKYIAEITN